MGLLFFLKKNMKLALFSPLISISAKLPSQIHIFSVPIQDFFFFFCYQLCVINGIKQEGNRDHGGGSYAHFPVNLITKVATPEMKLPI